MFGFARVRAGRGRRRSSGAACARGGRCRGDARAAPRSSRSCAATGAATAATSCTRAWRCCSSASPPRRASRTSATCACARPDAPRVGGYEVTYVKPTAELRPRPTGGWRRSTSAPSCACARDGERAARRCAPNVATSRRRTPVARARSRASSRARRRARSACRPGWRRDVWTAIAPDIGALRPRIEEGDKVFAGAEPDAGAARRVLGQALAGLARSYASDPPPATFRADRLAAGHLDLDRRADRFAGGLIALWPPPARRRAAARAAAYAARVGARGRASRA